MKKAIQERLERLLSARAREILGVWYSSADLPTAVLGAVGVPCLLRPAAEGAWELTCPWWTFRLAEGADFEERLLGKVQELTLHLAAAFAPAQTATMN